MQREQKVIVLKTMSYCNVLCEDKRLLNRVSDARKHHLKVAISQNFPCGAGRGKPPPPPTPPRPRHCVDIALLSLWLRGAPAEGLFFEKKTCFTFPSFTQNVKNGLTSFIEKRAGEWRYELRVLSTAHIWIREVSPNFEILSFIDF